MHNLSLIILSTLHKSSKKSTATSHINHNPPPLDNLAVKICVDVAGRALHDILNPALLRESVIVLQPTVLGIALDHLKKLFTGDKVV